MQVFYCAIREQLSETLKQTKKKTHKSFPNNPIIKDKKKMLCINRCHILILILINSTITFGAPQTDGYPSDDEDRVISHVIDPTSNETELFTFDSTNNDDRVVSTVVDMNSSDTSKLFNQFNISVEEVMRRISKQEQTNTHRNSDETVPNANDNEQRDKDEKG